MPKVILTAQVDDAQKWEAGFRTHGDVLRTYDLNGPVEYSIVGNDVALYMETKDIDKLKRTMQLPETAAAMAFDGVQRNTVKVFVMEKKMDA
jgi:hypothetical protein